MKYVGWIGTVSLLIFGFIRLIVYFTETSIRSGEVIKITRVEETSGKKSCVVTINGRTGKNELGPFENRDVVVNPNLDVKLGDRVFLELPNFDPKVVIEKRSEIKEERED